MTWLDVWTVIPATISNVCCALLGCYLLLRRLSLLGDAISHGVLPGIVLAFLFTGEIGGWAILAGAMIFGVLTAFLTETVRRYGNVSEDASLGVVYTSLFALGVVLITRSVASQAHLDAECVLYGDVLDVPLRTTTLFGMRMPEAMPTLYLALILTLVFILLLWKELKIVSFDPGLATAMGINALLLHYLLMAMVAGVTVASFEIIGSILVVAMLIVPPATAHLLTDRLPLMMLVSALVATISAVVGYAVTKWIESPAAGMMAVVAGIQFALAVFFAPRHGLLSRGIRNARLGLRIRREDVLSVLYKTEEAFQRGEAESGSVAWADLKGYLRGWRGWVAAKMLRYHEMVTDVDGTKITLTEKGRERAREIVRSHRLWESFIEENLNLPLDHLHEPAHQMEHFIGPGMQSELEQQVRQSKTDPHGRAIPAVPESASGEKDN